MEVSESISASLAAVLDDFAKLLLETNSPKSFFDFLAFLIQTNAFNDVLSLIQLIENRWVREVIFRFLVMEIPKSVDPRKYTALIATVFSTFEERSIENVLDYLDSYFMNLLGQMDKEAGKLIVLSRIHFQLLEEGVSAISLSLFVLQQTISIECCGQSFFALGFLDSCLAEIPEDKLCIETDNVHMGYLAMQELFLHLSAYCRLLSVGCIDKSLSFCSWVSLNRAEMTEYHIRSLMLTSGRIIEPVAKLAELLLSIHPEMFVSELALNSFLDKSSLLALLKTIYINPNSTLNETNYMRMEESFSLTESSLHALVHCVERSRVEAFQTICQFIHSYCNDEDNFLSSSDPLFFGKLFVYSLLRFDDIYLCLPLISATMELLFNSRLEYPSSSGSVSLSEAENQHKGFLLTIYELESIVQSASILQKYTPAPPISVLARTFVQQHSLFKCQRVDRERKLGQLKYLRLHYQKLQLYNLQIHQSLNFLHMHVAALVVSARPNDIEEISDDYTSLSMVKWMFLTLLDKALAMSATDSEKSKRFVILQQLLGDMKAIADGYFAALVDLNWLSVFILVALVQFLSRAEWKELVSLLLFESTPASIGMKGDMGRLSGLPAAIEKIYPASSLRGHLIVFLSSRFYKDQQFHPSFSAEVIDEAAYFIQLINLCEPPSANISNWMRKQTSFLNILRCRAEYPFLDELVSRILCGTDGTKYSSFPTELCRWLSLLDKQQFSTLVMDLGGKIQSAQALVESFPGDWFRNALIDLVQIEMHYNVTEGNHSYVSEFVAVMSSNEFEIQFAREIFLKSVCLGEYRVANRFSDFFSRAANSVAAMIPSIDHFFLQFECSHMTAEKRHLLSMLLHHADGESLSGLLFHLRGSSPAVAASRPVHSFPDDTSAPKREIDGVLERAFSGQSNHYDALTLLVLQNNPEDFKTEIRSRSATLQCELNKELEQWRKFGAMSILDDDINESFVNKLVKSGFSINGAKKSVFATRSTGTFESALQYAILHSTDVEFDQPIVLSLSKHCLLNAQESQLKRKIERLRQSLQSLESVFSVVFPSERWGESTTINREDNLPLKPSRTEELSMKKEYVEDFGRGRAIQEKDDFPSRSKEQSESYREQDTDNWSVDGLDFDEDEGTSNELPAAEESGPHIGYPASVEGVGSSTGRPPVVVRPFRSILSPKLIEIHQQLALSVELQAFLDSVFVDETSVSLESLFYVLKKLALSQNEELFLFLLDEILPSLISCEESQPNFLLAEFTLSSAELSQLVHRQPDLVADLRDWKKSAARPFWSFVFAAMRFIFITENQLYSSMTAGLEQALIVGRPGFYLRLIWGLYSVTLENDLKTIEFLKRSARDWCGAISEMEIFPQLEETKTFFSTVFGEELEISADSVARIQKLLSEECQLLKRVERFPEFGRMSLKTFIQSDSLFPARYFFAETPREKHQWKAAVVEGLFSALSTATNLSSLHRFFGKYLSVSLPDLVLLLCLKLIHLFRSEGTGNISELTSQLEDLLRGNKLPDNHLKVIAYLVASFPLAAVRELDDLDLVLPEDSDLSPAYLEVPFLPRAVWEASTSIELFRPEEASQILGMLRSLPSNSESKPKSKITKLTESSSRSENPEDTPSDRPRDCSQLLAAILCPFCALLESFPGKEFPRSFLLSRLGDFSRIRDDIDEVLLFRPAGQIDPVAVARNLENFVELLHRCTRYFPVSGCQSSDFLIFSLLEFSFRKLIASSVAWRLSSQLDRFLSVSRDLLLLMQRAAVLLSRETQNIRESFQRLLVSQLKTAFCGEDREGLRIDLPIAAEKARRLSSLELARALLDSEILRPLPEELGAFQVECLVLLRLCAQAERSLWPEEWTAELVADVRGLRDVSFDLLFLGDLSICYPEVSSYFSSFSISSSSPPMLVAIAANSGECRRSSLLDIFAEFCLQEGTGCFLQKFRYGDDDLLDLTEFLVRFYLIAPLSQLGYCVEKYFCLSLCQLSLSLSRKASDKNDVIANEDSVDLLSPAARCLSFQPFLVQYLSVLASRGSFERILDFLLLDLPVLRLSCGEALASALCAVVASAIPQVGSADPQIDSLLAIGLVLRGATEDTEEIFGEEKSDENLLQQLERVCDSSNQRNPESGRRKRLSLVLSMVGPASLFPVVFSLQSLSRPSVGLLPADSLRILGRLLSDRSPAERAVTAHFLAQDLQIVPTKFVVGVSLEILRTDSTWESLEECLQLVLPRKALLFCELVIAGLVYEAVFLFWQDQRAPRLFFPLEVAGKLLLQELLDERTRLVGPWPSVCGGCRTGVGDDQRRKLCLVDQALSILQTIF